MRILDAHIHLGWDCVFDEEQTEEQILGTNEPLGVQGGVVQPFISRPYIQKNREIHDRLCKFCNAHKGDYFGLGSINPHFEPEEYIEEATRCVKELGFVGLKITPIAHACHPASKDAYTVYETARKLGVPVMVHTGAGIPFADPVQLLEPIKHFHDLKIIIAHAGLDIMNTQAIQLAKQFDNAFLEPSWCSTVSLANMYRQCGAEKIMFSSDTLNNVEAELTKYRYVFKKEAEQEQVFHKTAEMVFKLKK
ncbi:amidohydrolase family protein [Dethiosulfatarculus sandiegensis]|uniref:Amidohydrolase-related domain-containing protein n=1 Tax=Dethiosulfatarculus sandiegensis TaxID=1429043 RepID=A0A0D2JWP6_9BACT|nr:amidohydrolase family protein [Dethiosulfatarculus sandiegensis]KIX13985.1 hypothetical protein X474_12880 [Dethiosulfatarculus sandiegensis]